jgi:hypothetical protein
MARILVSSILADSRMFGQETGDAKMDPKIGYTCKIMYNMTKNTKHRKNETLQTIPHIPYIYIDRYTG